MKPNTTDIRYVCLSDMHLGDEDSLLTSLRTDRYECDQNRASPVLVELIACLKDLVAQNTGTQKPTLILNGDILELAFASYGESLSMFEQLIKLVASPGQEIFDEIIFLPGNHDHHIWEVARETQFVNQVLRRRREGGLPPPMHTTQMRLESSVPSFLLNQILRHARGVDPDSPVDYSLKIIYPNLALVSDNGEKAVIVHHGHYTEPLFRIVSRLRRKLFPESHPPATVAELEAENFAWIDFVWSVLGRSGQAGSHAEMLYKKLQYPEHVEEFVDDLATRIASTTDIPFVPGDWMETKLLRALFSHVAKKIQGDRRSADPEAISDEIAEGLKDYLFRLTYRQMSDELGAMPSELSFVFGHTHKPFEKDFIDPFDRSVGVFNTGGWAVDSASARVGHGAAVALISANLDVANLRVYDELGAMDGTNIIRVVQTDKPSQDAQAFESELSLRLAKSAPLWESYSRHTAEAAAMRRQHLHSMFVGNK
ncbi:MAG: metallophosphoesterase [Kofleriaceae bacterium]|nr:metallophosphoesterase [Kofleriaceae bacterium]